MVAHLRCMYGPEPAIGWSRLPVSHTENQPQEYDVRFPRSTKRFPCPFPSCLGSYRTWNVLHLKFISQHWGDSIRILEEQPNTLPKCEHYGSQVPAGKLKSRHYASEKCKQGEERRLQRKTLQRCFEASRISFQINAEDLPTSEALTYLGRTIAYNNIDWAGVYQNLHKDRRRWGMVARVLETMGATVWSQGEMYKSVAH